MAIANCPLLCGLPPQLGADQCLIKFQNTTLSVVERIAHAQ